MMNAEENNRAIDELHDGSTVCERQVVIPIQKVKTFFEFFFPFPLGCP